ncbi:MAG: ATP-dependent DNA helicase RecG [Lachnospiraceae bacterium]|nr:ATP-dependent DNA helicase RecG [Lachnospiraceae bacterium]
MNITSIKGIGDKTAALFEKLDIYDTGDLLKFFPMEYDLFEPVSTIDTLKSGDLAAIRVYVISTPVIRRVRSLSILSFNVSDGHGEMNIVYFNAPYLRNSIKKGEECVFRGRVMMRGNRVSFNNPRKYKIDEYEKMSGTKQPIYHTTKGLSSSAIQKAVRRAYESELAIGVKTPGSPLYDTLPREIIDKRGLMPYFEAISNIHMPVDDEHLIKARERLAYQEFYEYILRMARLGTYSRPNSYPMIEVAETGRLKDSLPYILTPDQLHVWESIRDDLMSEKRMVRLLQGDVGSGKTIVAVLSLLMCVCNGYQGAFMAPTEVLASQHFDTICKLSDEYGLPFKPVLLTGQVKGKARTRILDDICEGEANLIIGTHALFQEKVEYAKLALVVTDEQHRFGVLQREALAGKGGEPAVLIMSATPIPRTLAMILYGDLEVSTIHTMPVGRLPIRNCVVDTSYRPTAYKFITEQVKAGYQVYIICPQIDSGELIGVENVTDYSKELEAALPEEIRIGVLHGQMSATMKDKVMNEFAAGNIDVLVSTTVVEVGVNVPNATVMYVENAERFGLAQLHQLRGRVGRSDVQSYCIFMMNNSSDRAKERLDILVNSNDGFEIAAEDMRLRGPGDIFGIRQSGDVIFNIGDIYQDSELIMWAKEDVGLFADIRI